MKLTIIRGVPSSGKSTYAYKHYDCLILENDQFAIKDSKYCWDFNSLRKNIDLVKYITELTLNNGSDICIANTFTKRSFIKIYEELAKKYGATFEVIRLNTSYPGNKHNVPDDVLKNMKENFEDWEGEVIID